MAQSPRSLAYSRASAPANSTLIQASRPKCGTRERAELRILSFRQPVIQSWQSPLSISPLLANPIFGNIHLLRILAQALYPEQLPLASRIVKRGHNEFPLQSLQVASADEHEPRRALPSLCQSHGS